ncbi:glycosyltransferase family 8 protein [Butyrivibrio sp. DSM 10294]|uniref:glycosyltransferase family 8 protein n=1 Tax=Butyrivibrio sp. DSM 10294 TaxID=2972457 RepID=UPI00234F47C1|nr:glycosyltransferase family 8 protein [Butyrivibrio sp. DSM 10294]MDC7292856.1 glycosyltransferase family 8 protein [Butyrivibrio sp. DSM 10294]
MLNVVYCTDNGYVIPTAISIKSLTSSNPCTSFFVYVLTSGIDKAGEQLLSGLGKEQNCQVFLIPVNNHLNDYMKVFNKNTNITTYARLLCEELLPKTIDKVLYVDGDTLFTDSIKYLENYSFDDELLCGVYDYSLSDYRVKTNIGYKNSDIYVNAGVLLINLKAWRQNKVSEKCQKMLLSNKIFMLGDQDVINLVCKDRIKLLPINFNMTGLSAVIPYRYYRFIMDKGVFRYYSKEQLSLKQKKPVIIHYASEVFGKPWLSNSDPVYEHVWHEYRKTLGIDLKEKKRIYSTNKHLAKYKKCVEQIIYPFYKAKIYGAVAILYWGFYIVPHGFQYLLWRIK